MKSMKIILFILIGVIIFLVALMSEFSSVFFSTSIPITGTYYVAKNGNDMNPGTEERPWRTITKAANTMAAGDTVYVKQGIYDERIIIKNSGSPGKYITYSAYKDEIAVIDGGGIDVSFWEGLIQIYGAHYINVSGFRIRNSRFKAIIATSDYMNSYPTNITIEKNHIRNISSSAIFIENGRNIIIDGNEITNVQTMQGLTQQSHETISLTKTSGFEIRNNILYKNNFENINAKEGSSNGRIHHNDISQYESAGIYVDAWNSSTSNIEIFGNRVHDGRISGRGIALAMERGGSLRNIKVYNNLIYRNAATGIDISWYSKGNMDNISIISNTVYSNGLIDDWGGGISIDYGLANNVIIRNNIISKNNHYSIKARNNNVLIDHNLLDGYIGMEYETRGDNFIEDDPLFVNPEKADFHLKSNSPAIDKGSVDEIPAVDFDDNVRPQNGNYDIGAFEFVK